MCRLNFSFLLRDKKFLFLIYVCMLQIIKSLKKLCCVFFVIFFVPSLLFNAVTPIYIYYLIQDLITSCPECRHWTKKNVYFQCDNFYMLFHSKLTMVVLFTLIWVWTQAKLFEILKRERERLNLIYMLPYLEVNIWEDGCLMVWVEKLKWKEEKTQSYIHTHTHTFTHTQNKLHYSNLCAWILGARYP